MKRTVLGALALLLIVLLALQAQVSPQSVTLAWNASPSPGIVGYEIHFGGARGGPYSEMDKVDNVTRATVSGLPLGETIYFAVKAVNDAGLKSPFSNEVAYLVAPPNPSATPNPSGPQIEADPASIAPGGSVVVTISNGPAGDRNAWVGLVQISNGQLIKWRYLDGTRSRPNTAVISGQFSLPISFIAGIYELQLMSGRDAILAKSNPITVGSAGPVPTPSPNTDSPPSGAPMIVAEQTLVRYFEPITAVISNGPGNRGDYYILCSVSEPMSYDKGWWYLNNQRTLPATGASHATVTRNAPNYEDTVEFRLFSAGGIFLARSAPIEVRR